MSKEVDGPKKEGFRNFLVSEMNKSELEEYYRWLESESLIVYSEMRKRKMVDTYEQPEPRKSNNY